MGEPFHNHFLKNLSGWWFLIESKNHWKVLFLLPSSFLYLSLSVEGEGNVLPLEFWQTLVRSRFTISGCERECVQRLMRRKYSDFQPLRGRENIFPTPLEMEHGTLQPAQCLESETSCLTILVSVWEARRDKEKQGLATRSVSYNQETLPSFFLPLLVVTKVNILAEAAGG